MILVRKVQMILISAKLAVLTKIAFAWSADNGRRPHFAKPEIGFFSIAGISKNLQLFAPNALACNASVFLWFKEFFYIAYYESRKQKLPKLAGIDFCQNWYLTLSPKAISNHNEICQHNGYIRQFLFCFCSFDKFYPDSHKRLAVLPVVCEVPLPGMNELNFLPLCAPTHCPSHTLRPNPLSVACFTIALVHTSMCCSDSLTHCE